MMVLLAALDGYFFSTLLILQEFAYGSVGEGAFNALSALLSLSTFQIISG